jgi:hypothetical protein
MVAPASNLPFGTPVTLTSGSTTSAWGSSAKVSSSFESGRRKGSLPPIPEMESAASSDVGAVASESDADVPKKLTHDEKLAKLKAKLEQKKKILEEKRKKDGAEAKATSTSLNAGAASFAPSSSEGTSRAARNALRFEGGTNDSTRSQLPADLRSKASDRESNNNSLRNEGGRDGREDLENAVSLVGKCASMCPDEEILRRELEGDIQLLEKPLPSILHPPNWTLRDTMVKRFRRSAADFKLDVPEWIRPPDVLERVCGYLEEWVMVGGRILTTVRDARMLNVTFH